MSLWKQLSAERRSHVGWGMFGVSISWSMAALMAYAGPASSSHDPVRVSAAHAQVTPLNVKVASSDNSAGGRSLSMVSAKLDAAMIKAGADTR